MAVNKRVHSLDGSRSTIIQQKANATIKIQVDIKTKHSTKMEAFQESYRKAKILAVAWIPER
eukprot:1160444-Pelagomonas_calceolata.AAC.3